MVCFIVGKALGPARSFRLKGLKGLKGHSYSETKNIRLTYWRFDIDISDRHNTVKQCGRRNIHKYLQKKPMRIW